MSENDIKFHLKDTKNLNVSTSFIQNIRKEFFDKVETSFPELDTLEDSELQGFYGYDEQYLKICGRRFYRIVILNLDTNKVIYQELVRELNGEKLESILKNLFGKNKPKGFVFDMRPMYIKAFQNVFGKQIKLQYCIFHLNKAILDKFNKSLKFLGQDMWTLEEVKKMYDIFDIFYDRTQELKYLDKLIFQRDFILLFSNSFEKKNLDKELRKQFRKNCYEEKLKRERKTGLKRLVQRTKQEASNKLDSLLELVKIPEYFPKSVVKQLRKIKKEFSYFSGGIEEGILTNNKLEGFFGSTLKKFRKKSFNVLKHFEAFLKLKMLRKLGKSLLVKIPPEKHLLAQMFVLAFRQ